jgi:hypothetical protein
MLPMMMGTDAAAERPVLSVTLSVASKTPFSSKVKVGFPRACSGGWAPL